MKKLITLFCLLLLSAVFVPTTANSDSFFFSDSIIMPRSGVVVKIMDAAGHPVGDITCALFAGSIGGNALEIVITESQTGLASFTYKNESDEAMWISVGAIGYQNFAFRVTSAYHEFVIYPVTDAE